MARTDLLQDLGIIYSKTGTALTTSYTAGADQSCGQATRLSLFVALTEAGSGSSMSSAEVKLQVKDVAGNYYDAITTLNNATGTTVIEQQLTSTAGSTLYYLIQSENLAPSIAGWRVAAKSTGATAAGDSIVIRAVVM